jgi:DNA modification methylase
MTITIMIGDVREQLQQLADNSVHCIVTSPPYWGLRDYGMDAQIGLEASPAEFIATLVDVFEELRRVLRTDGTCWLNMGDSYAGGRRGRDVGSGLQGSRNAQAQSRLAQARMVASRRRDNEPVPRSDVRVDGLKAKDLVMMPHRLAIALQDAGWWVRQDIVWAKPNPMPESVRDRCTKSHEYVFLLTKSASYYFDQDAIAEPVSEATAVRLSQPTLADQAGSTRVPGKTNGNMKAVMKSSGNKERKPASDRGCPDSSGQHVASSIPWEGVTRNRRSVWTITTQPFSDAHFATFPPELPETCIKAGCPPGGTVLDPFFGAGTTGLVADRLQRDCIGIELNPAYAEIARKRIQAESPLLADIRIVMPAPNLETETV